MTSLDYETTSVYQLILEVSDRGATSLKSAARATINVLPINERAPLMSAVNGTTIIPEDTAVGSLVYDANATGIIVLFTYLFICARLTKIHFLKDELLVAVFF